EAELLSGVSITDVDSAGRAAEALLETGLRRVFISMGGDGVLAADHSGQIHVPCIPGKMVNTTGCGDAFMAAIAWAYLEGTDLEGTARAGLAAASIAMESGETINPSMSVEEIRSRI
ncbi:MAG: MarR family transcriptional regulator, partial [Oscillospiraceae bacterium]|nr:MarR family transcriptional regulator [Oscillospiraceae bacterium]